MKYIERVNCNFDQVSCFKPYGIIHGSLGLFKVHALGLDESVQSTIHIEHSEI